MTLFEFISVAVSIVLGLSLAQMFTGVSQFARNSKRISYYLPHTLWLLNLLLLHFLMWWSFWDYRDVEWTYIRFITIALEPLAVFLVTSIAIPRDFDTEHVDLREYFHSIRRWFFVAFLIAEMLYIIDGPLVFNSEPIWMDYRPLQLIVVAAFVLGLTVKKDWAQYISVLTVNAMMLWASMVRFLPGAFS